MNIHGFGGVGRRGLIRPLPGTRVRATVLAGRVVHGTLERPASAPKEHMLASHHSDDQQREPHAVATRSALVVHTGRETAHGPRGVSSGWDGTPLFACSSAVSMTT
jgi:hypothetical protein